MPTFKEQIDEILGDKNQLKESAENQESDLAIIDRGLEESINNVLNRKVEEIFGRK